MKTARSMIEDVHVGKVIHDTEWLARRRVWNTIWSAVTTFEFSIDDVVLADIDDVMEEFT